MVQTKQHLTPKEMQRSLVSITVQVFKAAPGAVIAKLIDAVVSAILPIMVAYFAAQSTTALAAAYGGELEAGNRAVLFVLLTALVGLVSLVWGIVNNYIDDFARVRITNMMSDRLIDKFINLEFSQYDNKEVADLFDKADSFTTYAPFVVRDISTVFSGIVQIAISLVALTTVKWWFGLLLLCAVVPSALVQFKISRMQTEFWRGNVAKRRTASDIRWNIFQPKQLLETRPYGLIEFLVEMYRSLRNQDSFRRVELERKYLLHRLSSSIIETFAQLAVEISVVFAIIARSQPIGQFVYVQQLTSRIMGSASLLVRTVNGMDEQLATLYDYEKFMELPLQNETGGSLDKFPETIHVDKVDFTYPGAQDPALVGVTLSINKNQHVAIVGENGAGKSTLIKLIMGLYQPTGGAIKLDEQDLSDITKQSWHSYLSVLQQNYVDYWFATARENIFFGDVARPFDEGRYNLAIERAGAKGFIDKMPKGRDTLLTKWLHHDDDSPGVEISGGQWQRLALARNFYRDAELVILDEPTSAIDALAETKIFNYLFKESSKTIVTVSHRLSTVKKADVIYMMKDGRVVENGDYRALFEKRGEFYKMFQSQIE